MVRIHKSLLVETSPLFKDMFYEEITSNEPLDPILVDDSVDFDVFEGFLDFVTTLYGAPVQSPDDLAVLHHAGFFADKYQVTWLIEDIEKRAMKEITMSGLGWKENGIKLESLKACLGLIHQFDQRQLMNQVKRRQLMNQLKRIPLKVTEETAVDFYHLVKRYNMEKLMNQVVNYCCILQPKEDWPIDLIVRVTRKLRQGSNLSELRLSLGRTHEFQGWRVSDLTETDFTKLLHAYHSGK